VGLVVFIPVHVAGRIVGFSADHERYAPRPRGIHARILVEAARVFKAEGFSMLSLGLAPLHGLDDGDHPAHSPETRDILLRLRNESAAVYNFDGVSQHKKIYNPTWHPMHFCCAERHATEAVLDVFSLIGLIPPEMIQALSGESFDLLTP